MSDDTMYSVVVNHEEQYSLWPVGRPMPGGWKAVDDRPRSRSAALEYIRDVLGAEPGRIG